MQYIKATTTLYGVVSMQKVVEIYNEQNDDVITVDDLKRYSTEALEKEFVYAEDGYFAHQVIDDLRTMLLGQGRTPHYVPDRAELLRYVHRPPCEELEQYQALFRFVKEHFGARTAAQFCDDVFEAGLGVLTLKEIRQGLDTADITLTSREQMGKLLQLIVDLANHIRHWRYRGHTRMEMGKPKVLSVEGLLAKDSMAFLNPAQIGLWVLTILLWASLRNVHMSLLSAVLLVLDWVVLPFHLFKLEDRLLEREFVSVQYGNPWAVERDEASARTLMGLSRSLQAASYMLFGAAVWARFLS